MEYILLMSLLINIMLIHKIYKLNNQMFNEINDHIKALKDIDNILKRENYLLKTMNDSMLVADTKGFMAQRMKNAPKDFKPKTKEEINPDNINA